MYAANGKLIFLSILVNAGFALLIARSGLPQTTGQQSHSVHAAPGGQHPAGHSQMQGSGTWNTAPQWNHGGRGNNQGANSGNRSRGGRDSNSGIDQSRNTDRNKDRGHERRRDSDWNKHDRINKYNYDMGLFYYWPYESYFPNGFAEGSRAKANPYDTGYSDGFSAGQHDKVQGNMYNPRQYERSSHAEYFEGFVAGYQDGFRR